MILDTRVLYTLLVALVALGRLVELRIAKRNLRDLLARGGVEAAPGHYPWMVVLHAAFLVCCVLEVWRLDRPFLPALGIPMLGLTLLATGLRYWVVSTLGGRWTTRIVVLPGASPVTGGPYRFLRHPNYLAVITEMFALPLVHTAWITAASSAPQRAAPAGPHPRRGGGPRPGLRLRHRLRRAFPFDARGTGSTMNDQFILNGIADVARLHLGWEGEIAPEMRLVEDLRLDSIRLLTLAVEVENRFRVRLDELDEGAIETVGDLVAALPPQAPGGRPAKARCLLLQPGC